MNGPDKIFVAGGTGMVGSAIIRRLLSSGYTNIVSNYHSRPPLAEASHARVAWSQLDLRRQSDTEAFFEKERPAYVFLAAAKVGGILANDTYTAQFIYDNISIAVNVINSAYKYGAKKLLNLGSSCIYPRLAPQPLKEEYLLTGPLEPTNEAYAIAKIAAIKLCRYFNEQYNTNYISVMPTNMYGPNDSYNLESSHVLPALIRKFHLARLLWERQYERLEDDVQRHPVGFGIDREIRPGEPRSIEAALGKLGITAESVTIWGSGEPFREFLYVDDLAEAALFLMQRYDYGQVGEFINVGSGEDMKIKELALLIKKAVQFQGDVTYDTSKKDGMPKKALDVSRVNSLGWQFHTGLNEGIEQTYTAYVKMIESQ